MVDNLWIIREVNIFRALYAIQSKLYVSAPIQSLPFSPISKRRFHLYCKRNLTLKKVINKKLKQKEYNYEEI